MRRGLERAGNRLKGRSGELRDTLRNVDPLLAARRAGPSLIAAGGLTEEELLAGAFDDLVARYPIWVTEAAEEALGVYTTTLGGAYVNTTPDAIRALLAEQIERSTDMFDTNIRRIAAQRLYDPVGIDIDDVRQLVPMGLVRGAIAVAGGTPDVVSFGDAWVAVTATDTPARGIATGPTFTAAFEAEGGNIEAYRWVYGPASRDSFEPHRRLAGKTFETFDDEILRNGRAWPPFAYYIPGDHIGCSCDAEPVLIAPDGRVTLDIET